ncbi:trypsin-like peptidase domain-containing protein [Longispora sp. NPDC051575]|uniref:trypsin-like peptidase domain-containing protein n=1 Tax=Longispora sp. NPDC051575 TaxID=3154943 RepID=UPI00342E2853
MRRGTGHLTEVGGRVGRAISRLGLAALLGLVVVGVGAPAGAAPPSAEERAAAIARPAIVIVEIRWQAWVRDTKTGEVFGGKDGYRIVSSCTGFGVHADGLLVTAGHCVDPGAEGIGRALFGIVAQELAAVGRVGDNNKAVAALLDRAVAEGPEKDSPVSREVVVHRGVRVDDRTVDDPLPAEVVHILPHSRGDVAVLKVERGRLPALEIIDGSDLPVGTPILAIGFPGSADRISDPTLEPSAKDGRISNRRTIAGVPFYEVSAASTGGMSGGPVVDQSGRVIGLVSSAPAGEPQAFNFMAASSLVAGVLRGKEIPNGLGPVDRNYRSGLKQYYAGHHKSAIEYFDAVLKASPSHQQAWEYRRLAGQTPGSSAVPSLVIALCALVAVGTGVVAVFLFMLRRTAAAGGVVGAGPGTPIGPVSGQGFGAVAGPVSGPGFGVPAGPVSGPGFGTAVGPVAGSEWAPESGPDAGPAPGQGFGAAVGSESEQGFRSEPGFGAVAPISGPASGPGLEPTSGAGPLPGPATEPEPGQRAG